MCYSVSYSSTAWLHHHAMLAPTHILILFDYSHVEAPARQPPCQANATNACSHDHNFLAGLLVLAADLPCALSPTPMLTWCTCCPLQYPALL